MPKQNQKSIANLHLIRRNKTRKKSEALSTNEK